MPDPNRLADQTDWQHLVPVRLTLGARYRFPGFELLPCQSAAASFRRRDGRETMIIECLERPRIISKRGVNPRVKGAKVIKP